MKRLYVSDLDGTLLQEDNLVSDYARANLTKLISKGMNFTIATARTLATVSTIIEGIPINAPLVLMNGASVYDLESEKYLNVEYIPPSSLISLVDLIKEYNLKGFIYSIKDEKLITYYEDLDSPHIKDFYDIRVKDYKKPFTQIDDFSLLKDEPIVYMSIQDKIETLDPIHKKIKNIPGINSVLYGDCYADNLWYLEINSENSSKYHGVEFIRKHLKIEEITCFGDNENDIDLFRAADKKYAVANAVDNLKKEADEVILANTDEAVVKWLLENVI